MAENPELRLNLPQISSVPKLDLTVEQPLSMLTEDSIPLSAGSDSVGEISMLPSNSQFSRGKVETGNGFSIGNRSVRTPQSLGLELQTSPPEITSLTQPDVALLKIARNLLLTRTRDAIDIVFIIDASKSMRNDIDAVRKHLTQMTDLLKVKGLDFTVGVVTFRDGTTFPLLGWDFQVTPQTTSIQQIKETLNNISCRGGEKASNALVRAADKVKFRGNAERRFILVTDEYVSGSYSTKQVVTKMKSAKISVDVIGRAERFQEVLAEATGGIWLPISSLKE
ncbi:MAG: VWA domain-containing protein [Candidatus Poribacteria bacterium]|nr:VWA domain-containing protein [Candidatus Poribacteria bacterium]